MKLKYHCDFCGQGRDLEAGVDRNILFRLIKGKITDDELREVILSRDGVAKFPNTALIKEYIVSFAESKGLSDISSRSYFYMCHSPFSRYGHFDEFEKSIHTHKFYCMYCGHDFIDKEFKNLYVGAPEPGHFYLKLKCSKCGSERPPADLLHIRSFRINCLVSCLRCNHEKLVSELGSGLHKNCTNCGSKLIQIIDLYEFKEDKKQLIKQKPISTKVISPGTNEFYCPACNGDIDLDDIYCSHCGIKIMK